MSRPRVLVTGGRDYADDIRVRHELLMLNPSWVICGGATGADTWAAGWARENHVSHVVQYADWRQHGLSGGPIRNQQMLDDFKPDLVLAFPGGTGTADMKRRAAAAGIPVREVEPKP